ncbi:hypothetical protein ACIRQH_37140 [Streptomyces sp. NPDC102279]|uniref:hypothetical protein n=1 Tax=Streptomyces sp. NPDC102279 TaxID=3366153 RepID=UPI003812407F
MTKIQPDRVPGHEEIRFRLGTWQRLASMLPMAVPAGFGTVEHVGRPGFESWIQFLLIMLVLGVAVVSLTSLFGITLTPSAARVHNLRRRTIPWASVQSVRVEPIMGVRVVALYEADGRRTRLRAPTTGFLQWDRGFEEKFHVIGQWWLANRGSDWVPVPPPGTGMPT